MWNYEKRLQFPVDIKETNVTLASQIVEQFGGTDGELGASMRYLSQRYTMPYNEVTAALTDIGTEELAHVEMICAIVYQLTANADIQDIENTPFASYYIGHTKGLYPVNAAGVPWDANGFQSKGDPITDLHEDMAADGTIV